MTYTIEKFLEIIKEMAIDDMKKTGVLASLTIAQALLESQYGNSGLTKSANNLFGIKGEYKGQSITLPTAEYENGMRKIIQAKFRKYPSWEASLEDHSNFLKQYKRYTKVLSAKDYKKACHAIEAAGYATDPQYAEKLINLIERYKLYAYDVDTNTSTTDTTLDTLTIQLNGVAKQVQAVNVNGDNYIKLRDLADAKIQVSYDAEKKLPIVKVK